MAYLLTEIALEMLGCRFYDIYGISHDIHEISQSEQLENTHYATDAANLDTLLSFNKCTPNEGETKRSTIPHTPLIQLIEKEYNSVKQQILHKMMHLSQQKDIPKEATDCLETEKINLRLEAQTMKQFRKQMEQNVRTMNFKIYEEYSKMFTPNVDL